MNILHEILYQSNVSVDVCKLHAPYLSFKKIMLIWLTGFTIGIQRTMEELQVGKYEHR